MNSRLAPALDFGKAFALFACIAMGIAFWDFALLLPLKLVVVMIHETGHALATAIVGGEVERITISTDQSGECLSRLPVGFFARMVVASAGYVGSSVAAGALLIATLRFRASRGFLYFAAVWLAIIGVFYAGSLFTVSFSLATAIALGGAARFLPTRAVELLTFFIASFSALYAVIDLRDDLWRGPYVGVTDATILANTTFVPAFAWAVLWTTFSIVFVLICIVWAVRSKPRAPTKPRFAQRSML